MPIAQPGSAVNVAVNPRGLQTQPTQRFAAASSAVISATQGSLLPVSAPTASQQISRPTQPYDPAYTPPEQQQAAMGVNRAGQSGQPNTGAAPGTASALQRMDPSSVASNQATAAGTVNYGHTSGAQEPPMSAQTHQPLQSAPAFTQNAPRQPGNSRSDCSLLAQCVVFFKPLPLCMLKVS